MAHIATLKDIRDLFACNIVSDYEESKPIEDIAIKWQHKFVSFDTSVMNKSYDLMYRTVYGDVYRVHGTEYIVKRMPYPVRPFTLSSLRFDYYPDNDDTAHIDSSAHCRMVQYALKYYNHKDSDIDMSYLAVPIGFTRHVHKEPLRICINGRNLETYDCVDWVFEVPGRRLNHHWSSKLNTVILGQITKVCNSLLAIGLTPCAFNEGCFHLTETRSGVKITFVAVEHLYIHAPEMVAKFTDMIGEIKTSKPNLNHVNMITEKDPVRDLHQMTLNKETSVFIDWKNSIQYIVSPHKPSKQMIAMMKRTMSLLPNEWMQKPYVPTFGNPTEFVTYDASYDCRNLQRFRTDLNVMKIESHDAKLKPVTKEMLNDPDYLNTIFLQTLAIVAYTDHLTSNAKSPIIDMDKIWFREIKQDDEYTMVYQSRSYQIPIRRLEIHMTHWCTVSNVTDPNPIETVKQMFENYTMLDTTNTHKLFKDLINEVLEIEFFQLETAYFDLYQTSSHLIKTLKDDSDMDDHTGLTCNPLQINRDPEFVYNIQAINQFVYTRMNQFNLSGESPLFAKYEFRTDPYFEYVFDLKDDNNTRFYLMQQINLSDLTTKQINDIMKQVNEMLLFLHEKSLSLYTLSVGSFLINHQHKIKFHQVEHIYERNDILDQMIGIHCHHMKEYLTTQSKSSISRHKSSQLRLSRPKTITRSMYKIHLSYWDNDVEHIMKEMKLLTDYGYYQEYTYLEYRILVYPVTWDDNTNNKTNSILDTYTMDAQAIYDMIQPWIRKQKSYSTMMVQHHYIGFHDSYQGSLYAYDSVYPYWSRTLQELKETPCCMVMITDMIRPNEILSNWLSKLPNMPITIVKIFQALYALSYLFVIKTKHYVHLRLEDVFVNHTDQVNQCATFMYRKKNGSIVEYTPLKWKHYDFIIHKFHKVERVKNDYDAIDTMNEYLVTAYNELSQTKLSEVSELYDILFTTAV